MRTRLQIFFFFPFFSFLALGEYWGYEKLQKTKTGKQKHSLHIRPCIIHAKHSVILSFPLTAAHLRPSHLLVALLVQQLAQIVQAGSDGALVGVRVLQVLVRYVGAGQERALGLVQPSLVHQDDSRVQVGRWR